MPAINNGAEAAFKSFALETRPDRPLVFPSGKGEPRFRRNWRFSACNIFSRVPSSAPNLTLVPRDARQFSATGQASFVAPRNRKTFSPFQNPPISDLTPFPRVLGTPSSKPSAQAKGIRITKLSRNSRKARGTLVNFGLFFVNGCPRRGPRGKIQEGNSSAVKDPSVHGS